MLSFSLHLFLFLPYFFVMSNIAIAATDYILLNCGATSNTTSLDDHREWDTDSLPKYTKTPDILNSNLTSTSTAFERNPSVELIPYSSARIFHSKFTYTFPVSTAGQKFLRLYFYPTNYAIGLDKTKSFFSVNAATHSLLSNFSPLLNLQPPSFTLVKEYIITVNQSRLLVEVTFTPSSNSYAFVNGIEVVSIPQKLYIKGNEDSNDIKMVGQNYRFHIDDSEALEKLYRLNVGRGHISPTGDTGMFRSWDEDEPYVFGARGFTPHLDEFPINYTSDTPPCTAPEIVYSSARIMQKELAYGYNLTWRFEVDSGFYYLLRLYLCEFLQEVTDSGQRVFSIFINEQTAEQSADVILWSGGRGIPVYKDYVVFVSHNPDGSKGKKYLWLAMHPNFEKNPDYKNVILNGLEIFKLSQPGGSLAAPNPEFVPSPASETKKPGRASNSRLVGACIGGSLGGIILLLSILGFILFRRRREKSQDVDTKSRSTNTNISSLPSVRSRKFSLEEIKLATSNFDDNFVIGLGGFGNVYKGYMENGTLPVAIKRLNPSSRQGYHEFQTEITMLSNLRHLNLVPLIGYCDDSGEMILVYDYMVHGTLRSHLYRRGNNPPLSWKQRLQICIGAAKGLHYLHAGAERVIIHRDVKSTNILLDGKMIAKVSDFGLSKLGPSNTSVTHVSTIVKGSFGYLDPEYYRRQQLTTKSDVYSFGVVLFEVLCARPVVMQELPNEQKNLAEWARNCYRKGCLGELVDPNLMGEIAVESLNKFGDVGYNCLRDQGIDRPTMSDVVWSLEFALQLQESHEKLMHPTVHLLSGAKNNDDDDLVSTKIVGKDKTSDISTTTSSSEGFKSGSIFSEILNPNAR